MPRAATLDSRFRGNDEGGAGMTGRWRDGFVGGGLRGRHGGGVGRTGGLRNAVV